MSDTQAKRLLLAMARIVDQRPPTAQEIVDQGARVIARIDQVVAAVNSVDAAHVNTVDATRAQLLAMAGPTWLARYVESERSPFAQNVALRSDR